jgi:hypothetical protein
MNRRIIFISSPLGFHKKFIVDRTEDIFSISENEKRLYFTLGHTSQLVSTEDFWPNIQKTIDDQLKRYPESTFIYYGWHVIEYFDNLRTAYPDAECFGFYSSRDHGKLIMVELLGNLYDIPHDENSIRNKMHQHYDRLEQFYELGEPTVTVLTGYERKDKSRKCFFIN